MDRPTKLYEQVKVMLGNASLAWEKLVGHIRFYYEVDEIWAERKPMSEGGEVVMELQQAFFSEWYGIVKDKFGIYWQILQYSTQQ